MPPASSPTARALVTRTLPPSLPVTSTPAPSAPAVDEPLADATPTEAPSPAPAVDTQLASRLDSFLAGLAAEDRFSGSVLVAKDGQVILSQGYGLADRARAAPNTPQTVFRIGSLTKQFTALAVLQLQQMGKLDVQDPICTYLPDCPAAWQPITIHQLLTHTSGIPELTVLPTYSEFKKQPATAAETIDRFRNLALDFAPGERWSYSNSGYIVLGAIVEAASGEPYCDFVDKHITQPLQMASTGCEATRPDIANRAVGYADADTLADTIDMSVPLSGGGLVSSVEDLYRWDQALYTTTLLPQPLLDELFAPTVKLPDSPQVQGSYGYGWIIGDQLNRRRIWHRGGIEGFVSEIDRYPDRRESLIFLSNREDNDLPDITSQIAQMILEGD